MSFFTAFATGALEETYRRQQEERAQELKREEREEAFEQAQKLEKFKFDLKNEAEELQKKRFFGKGTDYELSWQKGKNDAQTVVNFMDTLTDEKNQDIVNSILGDDSSKQSFAKLINNIIGKSINQGLFTFKQTVDDKQTDLPIENFTTFFGKQLNTNRKLKMFFKRVEDKGARDFAVKDSSNVAALTNNRITNKVEPVNVLPEAAAAYGNGRPKRFGESPEESNARFAKELYEKIDASYDKKLGKFDGENKFYTIAKEAPLAIKYLQNLSPTERQSQAFLKALKNPEYEFFKRDQITKTMRPTQDYYKLIDIYGLQNATKSKARPGFPIAQSKFVDKNTLKEITKKSNEMRGITSEAIANLKGYYKLLDTKSGANVASGFAQNVLQGFVAVPAVIKQITSGVSNLTNNVFKFKNQNFEITGGDNHKREMASLKRNVEILNDSKRTDQELALARAAVFEISLLYQLAAIKQGGTGGRTISDQDIAIMRNLLGGAGISADQKKEKLRQSLIEVYRIKDRVDLLSQIRSETNSRKAEIIQNLANNTPYADFGAASARADRIIKEKNILGVDLSDSELFFQKGKDNINTVINTTFKGYVELGGQVFNMKSLNVNKKRALKKYIMDKYNEELTVQFTVENNNIYLLSSDNRGVNLSKALSPQGDLTPITWTGGKGTDIEIDDPSLNTQVLVNNKNTNVNTPPITKPNVNTPPITKPNVNTPPITKSNVNTSRIPTPDVYNKIRNLYLYKPPTGSELKAQVEGAKPKIPVLESPPGDTRRRPTAEEQANRGNVN